MRCNAGCMCSAPQVLVIGQEDQHVSVIDMLLRRLHQARPRFWQGTRCRLYATMHCGHLTGHACSWIHVADLVTLQQPLVQEVALQDGVVAIACETEGRHMYRLSLSIYTQISSEAAPIRAPVCTGCLLRQSWH